MKIISWNTNSRTNLSTLNSQCEYLKSKSIDIITLQEVTLKSESYFKKSFQDFNILSSFALSKNLSELINKRKYGQLIISKYPISYIERCEELPYPERLLSGYIESLDIEIHTTHVPPGSSNGVIKVEHFEGLYKFLSLRDRTKILTGDFNSPKLELENGKIITWGQKISSTGKVRTAVNPKWKDECSGERWDAAERSIIENHTQLNLKDAFRDAKGYIDKSGSWFTNKGMPRRYDHIFCSNVFKVKDIYYDHEPRMNKLSDHSPLIASIK